MIGFVGVTLIFLVARDAVDKKHGRNRWIAKTPWRGSMPHRWIAGPANDQTDSNCAAYHHNKKVNL